LIAAAIIFFGMGFEYLWEIYEFFMDTFFGGSLAGPMQANNADTMSDMIFVLLSSIIVAVICYYYLYHHGKEAVMHNMVKDSPYFKE
jgi:divalent metal cation (Fe/Co/Zn/Cd) transporter